MRPLPKGRGGSRARGLDSVPLQSASGQAAAAAAAAAPPLPVNPAHYTASSTGALAWNGAGHVQELAMTGLDGDPTTTTTTTASADPGATPPDARLDARFDVDQFAWSESAGARGFLSQTASQRAALPGAGLGDRRSVRDDFNSPTSLQVPPRSSVADSVELGDSSILSASRPRGPSTSARPRPNRTASGGVAARNSPTTRVQSSAGEAEGGIGRIHLSEMPTTYKWDRLDEAPQSSSAARRSASRNSPRDERPKSDAPTEEDKLASRAQDSNGNKSSILRARQVDAFANEKGALPAERGFPIQIGSELFRLSGASIMSDAPSYFSKFFQDQLNQTEDSSAHIKTLYIDRDPVTFQDIALHLQGYHVNPRDGSHYVKLFADAQFYGLPKLIKQLFESEICIRIGEQNFQVSRDIFSSPGNSPNFFSLGFAIFAPAPGEIFPGLEREGLFRPPSIDPPSLLNRSARTFGEILHLLRGYPLHIRSPEHRQELLRDCRYYHLRGLEQSLLQHHISYNVTRQRHEILMRLEDIRQSGLSFSGDVTPSDRSPLAGWVNYARPFVDESSNELVLEIGDEECTRISLRTNRAEFFGQTKARITSLFQVVANKMNLPVNVPLGLMMVSGGASAQSVSPGNTPLSDDLVKIQVGRDAHVVLDGEEYQPSELPRGDMHDSDTGDLSMPAATSGGGGPGGAGTGLGLGMAGLEQASSASGASTALLAAPSRSPSVLPPPRKRKRRGSLDDFGEWIVRRGQWRLRVQPRPEQPQQQDGVGGGGGGDAQRMEIVMLAVKLDAVSGQRGRNAMREFLN